MDYGDDDNLVDVLMLAQLDAIRYDPDGAGISVKDAGDAKKYLAAFPGLTAGMGCPTGCDGYELRANPDFDTTGDNTADAPYANWLPIGTYAGVLNGNGHIISNLNVNRDANVGCSRNWPAAALSSR